MDACFAPAGTSAIVQCLPAGPASPSAPQRLFWRPMYGVACPADLVRPSWSIASVKVVRSLGSNEVKH